MLPKNGLMYQKNSRSQNVFVARDSFKSCLCSSQSSSFKSQLYNLGEYTNTSNVKSSDGTLFPSQNLLSWNNFTWFNISRIQCQRERLNLQLMFCIIRRPLHHPLQMPLSTTAPAKITSNYYECSTMKQMFIKWL